MIAAMSNENFEDALRAIAQNLGDSLKRLAGEDFDLHEAVRATGLDPEEAQRRAREWFSARAAGAPAGPSDPLRDAAPHPLDVPTEEQGVALAALDSERWTVEPGTDLIVAHGPGPRAGRHAGPGARAARARLAERRRAADARRAPRAGALAGPLRHLGGRRLAAAAPSG